MGGNIFNFEITSVIQWRHTVPNQRGRFQKSAVTFNIPNFFLFCGNKMPTRCNKCFFYCRSYCLLNMFRAPLCPSSGALEYYTAGCRLWSLVLWFFKLSLWCGAEDCVSGLRAAAHKQETQLYNTLELLMMGIMVPKTCWASNKICNKKKVCCIQLAFYFHILKTMHGQNHFKFLAIYFRNIQQN
jgi:hypothetical protein